MNDFIFQDDELIGLLKPFQKEILLPLINSVGEEEAARIWLAPKLSNEMKNFGGVQSNPAPFFDRVLSEIRMFICGDEKYKSEREKLIGGINKSASTTVSAISLAVGDVFGIAPALLTPIVIMILKMIGKIGVNAWCAIT